MANNNKERMNRLGLTPAKLNDITMDCLKFKLDKTPINEIRKILAKKYKFTPEVSDENLARFVEVGANGSLDIFFTKFTGLTYNDFKDVINKKKIPSNTRGIIASISRIIENTFITIKKKDINIMKDYNVAVVDPSEKYIYRTIIRLFNSIDISNENNNENKAHSNFFNRLLSKPLQSPPIKTLSFAQKISRLPNEDKNKKHILYFECSEIDIETKIETIISFYINVKYFKYRARRYKHLSGSQSGIICIGIISLMAIIYLVYLNTMTLFSDEALMKLMYTIYFNPFVFYNIFIKELGFHTMKTRKECIESYLSLNKNSYKLKDDIINKFMKDLLIHDELPIDFSVRQTLLTGVISKPLEKVEYIKNIDSNKPKPKPAAKKIETGFTVSPTQTNKPANPTLKKKQRRGKKAKKAANNKPKTRTQPQLSPKVVTKLKRSRKEVSQQQRNRKEREKEKKAKAK